MEKTTFIRKCIAYVALTAFLLSLVNRVRNYHLHRLPNGQVVVHAHPYKKDNTSPFQQHKHSAFEMFWLDHLAKTVYVLALALGISLGFCLFQDTIFSSYFYHSPRFRSLRVTSLRGPPIG